MNEQEDIELSLNGIVVHILGRRVAEVVSERKGLKCILIRWGSVPERYIVCCQRHGSLIPEVFVNPNVDSDTEMGRSRTGMRMQREDVIEFFPDLARNAGWTI